MAVEGKGRLGHFKLPLNPRTPIHTSLLKLGDRGEARKGGGGERAPSSYTTWHSPERGRPEGALLSCLGDTLDEQDFRVGGEEKSAPNSKRYAGNGGKAGEFGMRFQPQGALLSCPLLPRQTGCLLDWGCSLCPPKRGKGP